MNELTISDSSTVDGQVSLTIRVLRVFQLGFEGGKVYKQRRTLFCFGTRMDLNLTEIVAIITK